MIKVYDIRGEDDLRLAKIKNRQYFVVLYFFALTSWYVDENEIKKKKKFKSRTETGSKKNKNFVMQIVSYA